MAKWIDAHDLLEREMERYISTYTPPSMRKREKEDEGIKPFGNNICPICGIMFAANTSRKNEICGSDMCREYKHSKYKNNTRTKEMWELRQQGLSFQEIADKGYGKGPSHVKRFIEQYEVTKAKRQELIDRIEEARKKNLGV